MSNPNAGNEGLPSPEDVLMGLFAAPAGTDGEGDEGRTAPPDPEEGEDDGAAAGADVELETEEVPAADEAPAGTDDGEVEDEPPPTPPTYKVKADGAEVEVTLDELLKGYSRTADYTRKTQKAAELAKAAEAEQAQARERRDKYAQALEQVAGVLEAAAPKEPDWDKLKAELDPSEYASAHADWQRLKDKRQVVNAERDRVAREQAEEAALNRRKFVEGERTQLASLVPAWKDPKQFKVGMTQVVDYLLDQGFSESEIGQVVDHRHVLLLRKAMLYDQAKAALPGTRTTLAVRPATPGNGRQPAPQTRNKRAFDRLSRTGDPKDAGVLFEQFID